MDRVPALTKLFVAGFLALVLGCGLFVIEAWPFTGWRLFSYNRSSQDLGWRATTVSPDGVERRIFFPALPPAYRHLPQVMRDFGHQSEAKQEAICRAWATGVQRHTGRRVAGVRIYRTVADLRLHEGRRERVPITMRLRYTCADGRGVRAHAIPGIGDAPV